MSNSLIRFIESQNEQGRARFAALNTDTERLIHTKYTAGVASIVMAIAFVILYIPVLSVMYVHFVPPEYRAPIVWKYLVYLSVWFGGIQGSAAGSVVGWGLGLFWQNKRHKAGVVLAVGGAIGIFLLILFQSIYFDIVDMPLDEYIFWAVFAFSPAYFTATGALAWGLALLTSKE